MPETIQIVWGKYNVSKLSVGMEVTECKFLSAFLKFVGEITSPEDLANL